MKKIGLGERKHTAQKILSIHMQTKFSPLDSFHY